MKKYYMLAVFCLSVLSSYALGDCPSGEQVEKIVNTYQYTCITSGVFTYWALTKNETYDILVGRVENCTSGIASLKMTNVVFNGKIDLGKERCKGGGPLLGVVSGCRYTYGSATITTASGEQLPVFTNCSGKYFTSKPAIYSTNRAHYKRAHYK